MGDVLDAVSARIKAPYFGYAVLAFVAWNWRALFLLVMLDGSPELRLSAFDANTNFWRLYVAPIFTGVCVAASAEWVSFGFEWISRKPLHWRQMQNLEAGHEKILKKLNLEKARNEGFARQEEALIARATRDGKVLEIKDETLKEQLKEELEKLRDENKKLSRGSANPQVGPFSDFESALLKAAESDGQGVILRVSFDQGGYIQAGGKIFGNKGKRDFSRYDVALMQLLKDRLVSQNDDVGGQRFELTELGWEIAEALS